VQQQSTGAFCMYCHAMPCRDKMIMPWAMCTQHDAAHLAKRLLCYTGALDPVAALHNHCKGNSHTTTNIPQPPIILHKCTCCALSCPVLQA
jgi:hypothetical protein